MSAPRVTGSNSQAWFDKARELLPGGVSSPVRAFGAVGGTPPVIRSAQGAYVTDIDGASYLDFVGSWGPLILGHAQPQVVAAIEQAVRRGTSYGAPCQAEIELAAEVVASYPGLEQVRFVSSGTEAVMSAIRLARGATGRDLIVKFSGCYHGHVDSLLVAAGSGLVTFGTPSSAGVPSGYTDLTRVLPLDDEHALEALFTAEGDQIAAVIIEPVPANNGLLLQQPQFLQKLRALTSKHGSLLIFDEVISGFRLGPGGAAAHYGITPDLATFGKVIGGGMPVGAFGGKRDVMEQLAPLGRVYQAGTLSGNPVAMAAGLATLQFLKANDGWDQLEARGAYLEQALTESLSTSPVPARLARLGSMFWIAWYAKSLPRTAEAIAKETGPFYAHVFHGLLARGVALAPSAYEIGFVSLAHSQDDLEQLAATLTSVLADLKPSPTAGVN